MGRERRVADWLWREMLGWEVVEEDEEEEVELEPEAFPGRGKCGWWALPSGLVVRDRGCACSE